MLTPRESQAPAARILRDDKSRPKKQQHTSKRIFERLRDERLTPTGRLATLVFRTSKVGKG